MERTIKRPLKDDRGHCFIPHSKIKNVLQKEIHRKYEYKYCNSSLLRYHYRRVYPQANKNIFNRPPIYVYLDTIRYAIMKHDWDRLLFLLLKFDFDADDYLKTHVEYTWSYYVKAVIILLVHHPHAKADGLLLKYGHLALGFRSEDTQKALMKMLFSISEQPRLFYESGHLDESESAESDADQQMDENQHGSRIGASSANTVTEQRTTDI